MNTHSSSRLETLRKLAIDYQELNGTHYETLDAPPSAVEFLRLVHIARPAVIKGCTLPAADNWTDEYLINRMGSNEISVAVTPNGQADAVTVGPGGLQYFVEPHVQKTTLQDFLSILSPDASSALLDSSKEVHYLQSQNGNVFSNLSFNDWDSEDPTEFALLRDDVPKDIPWASKALGKFPDAVNLWIGDGRSVTSVHSDPYENIYTVIRGEKNFTLFPPTEGWCLKECTYPHATYTRSTPQSGLILTPSPAATTPVRWSSIANPTDVTSLPPEARPLRITLHAGDTLYLPAGWWHHVRQRGVTIALNWWYDMEMRGMSWVWLSFLRGEGDNVCDGNNDSPVAVAVDEETRRAPD